MLNKLNKYIGIPYKDHGRDFDGCDCYGLVALFLDNELGIKLPDVWKYVSAGDTESVAEAVEENKPLIAGEEKDNPEVGDLILYRFKGVPSHIGVYVGKGRVLHVLRGRNSVCEPYEFGILKGRIEGIYEIHSSYYSGQPV